MQLKMARQGGFLPFGKQSVALGRVLRKTEAHGLTRPGGAPAQVPGRRPAPSGGRGGLRPGIYDHVRPAPLAAHTARIYRSVHRALQAAGHKGPLHTCPDFSERGAGTPGDAGGGHEPPVARRSEAVSEPGRHGRAAREVRPAQGGRRADQGETAAGESSADRLGRGRRESFSLGTTGSASPASRDTKLRARSALFEIVRKASVDISRPRFASASGAETDLSLFVTS